MENNNDNNDLQNQLDEVYSDHKEAPQEYEIDEITLKNLYDKMRRSQEMSRQYIAAQNRLWGIKE